MKIVFLGTGAAVPTKYRNHSSLCMTYESEVFLFDCGEGTQRQLIYTNISPMKINNIFISHLHGDHILGLAGLLQTIGFHGRIEPINIYGPIDTKKTVKNILKIGNHSINFKLNIFELDNKEPLKIINTEKYEIYAYEVNHSISCYSYIFKEKKKPKLNIKKALQLGVKEGPDLKKLKEGSNILLDNGKIIYSKDVLLPPKKGICVAYSGDTTPLEEYGKFLKSINCKILIHEATFDSSKKDNALETMHTTISEAVKIAKIANVETLILTHISARYNNDDFINIYNKELENIKNKEQNMEIILSYDLMEYIIR